MEAQFETHCEGLESEEQTRAAQIKQLKSGKGVVATPPPETLEEFDELAFSPVPPVPFSYGGPNAAALIAQALQARAELFPADNSSFGPVSTFSDGAASMLRTATSAMDSYRHRGAMLEEGSSPPQDHDNESPSADSWDNVSLWEPNQASLVEDHHRQRRRRLSSNEGFLGAAALGLDDDQGDEDLPDLDV
jgi:hypothetical protein